MWQPIETAPKDTWVLVWEPGVLPQFVGHEVARQETGGVGRDTGWFSIYHEETLTPTHWMPLPEPPA